MGHNIIMCVCGCKEYRNLRLATSDAWTLVFFFVQTRSFVGNGSLSSFFIHLQFILNWNHNVKRKPNNKQNKTKQINDFTNIAIASKQSVYKESKGPYFIFLIKKVLINFALWNKNLSPPPMYRVSTTLSILTESRFFN